MNNFKPLFGVGAALLFIVLGFNLIEKEDQSTVIIGYVNIVFWLGVILFTLYKIITQNKNNL